MQLDALRVFTDVLRLRSFTRAAKEHGLTQSAVSQSVQQLEQELGVRLVDRSTRPLKATDAGQLFFEGCRELLDRFDRVVQDVRAEGQEVKGGLTVATIYSVGLYGMRPLLDRFRVLHPGVRVQLEVGGGKKVATQVAEGQADLGILSFPRATRRLQVEPLPEQPLRLVCGWRHRLAATPDEPVTREELLGERWIRYEQGLPIRRLTDRFLRAHDLAPTDWMEIDNTETIKQALRELGGVALLPAPNVRPELRAGSLVARPLAFGELTRPIGVLHRRSDAPGPVLAAFLDMLREEPELWGL